MKDKLTSADPAGWWLCEHNRCEFTHYWNGQALRTSPTGFGLDETYTNFRRLTEVAEPEVIEGRGQPLEKGWYWREGRIGLDVAFSDGTVTAITGCRYIRIPEPHFPPRPPAIPPKPELVLVQLSQGGNQEWAVDAGDKVCLLGGKVNKSAFWKVERQA